LESELDEKETMAFQIAKYMLFGVRSLLQKEALLGQAQTTRWMALHIRTCHAAAVRLELSSTATLLQCGSLVQRVIYHLNHFNQTSSKEYICLGNLVLKLIYFFLSAGRLRSFSNDSLSLVQPKSVSVSVYHSQAPADK
jgi:hypothetical protein